jgi:hypothetical protein
MLGAQRRIEGRIGQLLGDTTQGERFDLTLTHATKSINRAHDRLDFRLLARALDGDCALTDEEWQSARIEPPDFNE